MSNIEWTKMPKKEFKKEMFDTGIKIRDLMLSTSGCEEGMNVLLTILATTICSISDKNWESLIHTSSSGVADPTEGKIGEITTDIFKKLDKLRHASFGGDSKYVSYNEPIEDDDDNDDEIKFTFRS